MNATRPSSVFRRAIDEILCEAAEQGASDIHFEPLSDRVQIRIRVDGVLWTLREMTDQRRRTRLMEAVKRACNFDMGQVGVPQDARFGTVAPLPYMDYRAALTPLLEGEKIVLRLLERAKEFDLDKYRLRNDAKTDLREALAKRDGLIIVSGPTGSGKSTLLYNAMGSLDRKKLNTVTAEDPVEYRLAGICQSQVDRSRGVDFAGLLRSFLRADPDVILVGEIRDCETAEAALHAASTGHLVLSTVHANSTAEISERLEGLGVNRGLYEANLRFASAQRLVSRNCTACRVPDPDAQPLVQATFGVDVVPMRGVGCGQCQGRGIAGRALLFEWQHRSKDEIVSQETLQAEAQRALCRGDIDAHNACGY